MANVNQKRTEYYKALKTLEEGPKKIESAFNDYTTDIANIRGLEKTGNFSPVYIGKMKKAAAEKRDSVVGSTVGELRKGLSVIREKNAESEDLDIDNPSLQNALKIIEIAGRKLSPSNQLSILNKFRGDFPTLRFLADVYDRNGYFYADEARRMVTGVSNTAIEDLEYCLNSYDMLGKWPADKMFWTKKEWGQARERLEENPKDPYVKALENLMESNNSSVRRAAAEKLKNIKNEGRSDEEEAIIKKALDDIVSMIDANPDQEPNE